MNNREQLKELVLSLIGSVRAQAGADVAGFDLGPTRAFYGEASTRLETFSRTLWAAAPLCANGELDADWIVEGLTAGTDPEHPGFWGWPGDMDSRMVEMTAIAFALRIAPEAIWSPLSPTVRSQVVAWLSRINRCHILTQNWLYFRVFVNEALRSLGEAHDAQQMEADLQAIESLYLGDGWYGDGVVGTLDYYNAFAFHFYGLIYAKWAGDRDPARAQRFREQSTEFAESFIYWWGSDGSAIPFGRSLVYRFGMSAFWAAAIYTELPILKKGEVKGLWLRHLRWWFDRPILDAKGVLNLGYAYPNQNMVEMYNAPGSPMWAFKAFLPLVLPEGHAFWQEEEAPMPDLELKAVPMPDGKKVLGRSAAGHAWMLSAGQNLSWQGRAFFDKYARFAYSNLFGFSVSVENSNPAAMAPDSSLIVSVDGKQWFGRRETTDYAAGTDWVESSWLPCPGVQIRTRLTITPEGHTRRHEIQSKHPLEVMEGGFALPRPVESITQLERNPVVNFTMQVGPCSARAEHDDCFSSIRAIGDADPRAGQLLEPWASTHVLFPASIIPVLKGQLPSGKSVLECEVQADAK